MPSTFLPLISGLLTGVPGQICTRPVAISCEPTHWLNWPMERTRPPFLWRNFGVQGSSKAWSLTPASFAYKAKEEIAETQKCGAAAGAGGIEEIEDAFVGYVGGHGDFRGVETGKAGADALGAGNYATDAGGDVVGALVAEDLEGHSGGDFALEGGIIGMLGPLAGERRKKASHCRAETSAGYIDFHGLAV